MKRYVKSDINSYSYTGPGFVDERIILARYNNITDDNEDGYIVSLVKEGFSCYVEVEDYQGEMLYEEYYLMKDIESAIADFNKQAKKYGNWRTLKLDDVKFHLSEGYGISLDDYLPGGFYDKLRKPE